METSAERWAVRQLTCSEPLHVLKGTWCLDMLGRTGKRYSMDSKYIEQVCPQPRLENSNVQVEAHSSYLARL